MDRYCLRYLMVASTPAFLLAVTIPAFAQTPPVQVKSATTSEQGESKDRGTRTLIVQVFGEQLYLEQFTPPEADAKRKDLTLEKFQAWLFEFQQEHLKAGDIRFHHVDLENAVWKYAQRERFAAAGPGHDEQHAHRGHVEALRGPA